MPDLAVRAVDIREAANRISAKRTPVMTSRSFDREAGVAAFFKCENLQTGGSFKIRGASNFINSIPPLDRVRGVVAYSSGNHAQAVAIAAREANIKATLVMPEDAPKAKMEATRAMGGHVVTYNRHREQREAIGASLASQTGATLIPPFDHPWIIAGQGTTALELLDAQPQLDALVVCTGGGGLLSGCSIIAKAFDRNIRVFGAEPQLANDHYLSLRAGHPVTCPTAGDTIADGLRAPKPGQLTFPIIQQNVEDILLVSEDEILAAMRLLLTRLKLVVEPSGAVAAAAVLFGRLPAGCRRVGVTISGGNVDLDMLARLA
jgi:threonine dehydratase